VGFGGYCESREKREVGGLKPGMAQENAQCAWRGFSMFCKKFRIRRASNGRIMRRGAAGFFQKFGWRHSRERRRDGKQNVANDFPPGLGVSGSLRPLGAGEGGGGPEGTPTILFSKKNRPWQSCLMGPLVGIGVRGGLRLVKVKEVVKRFVSEGASARIFEKKKGPRTLLTPS